MLKAAHRKVKIFLWICVLVWTPDLFHFRKDIMIPEQRYKIILDTLREDGTVKTSELAERLGTSYETIRRALSHLEKEGLLRRSPGGAMPVDVSPAVPTDVQPVYQNFSTRLAQEPAQKKEIAELAAELITENDIIAMDSGSTSLSLARVIRERFRSLTVITNSLPIANELAAVPGITIILTGGIYRRDEGSLVTDIDSSIVDRLNIHTFFLTACGLSVSRGVTYQRIDELAIQNQIMRCSERTVAIADSTKLGTSSLVKMCDIGKISCIVTDQDASDESIRPFADIGIRVIRSREDLAE